MAIPFVREFEARYGVREQVSPLIARVLANNPGPFTFKGTGTYIIGGNSVAVIDPGPDLPEHVEALKRALAGKRVSHILVTHTHSDHSPAAEPLKKWSGAKTFGFGPHGGSKQDEGVRVEEGGDRDFVPDICVKDRDVIVGGDFAFECVHTPGHTSNHMCFALRQEKALFTGDHVMGWSTTVVTPPDGDMAQYRASLRKLQARSDVILYPTHGAPVPDPKPLLQAYIDHRFAREAEIAACLKDGIDTIPAMVARIYADIDEGLHPAASRSVLAHLIQMMNEGQVVVAEDGRYRLK